MMLSAIIVAAASCIWVTSCDRGSCVQIPHCSGGAPNPGTQFHTLPQQPAPQSQPGVNYAPLYQRQQCRAVTMCDTFGNCRPQTICN